MSHIIPFVGGSHSGKAIQLPSLRQTITFKRLAEDERLDIHSPNEEPQVLEETYLLRKVDGELFYGLVSMSDEELIEELGRLTSQHGDDADE